MEKRERRNARLAAPHREWWSGRWKLKEKKRCTQSRWRWRLQFYEVRQRCELLCQRTWFCSFKPFRIKGYEHLLIQFFNQFFDLFHLVDIFSLVFSYSIVIFHLKICFSINFTAMLISRCLCQLQEIFTWNQSLQFLTAIRVLKQTELYFAFPALSRLL